MRGGGVCCENAAAWMPPWPAANMHTPAGQAKRERGRNSGEENCATALRQRVLLSGELKPEWQRDRERERSDERKQRGKVSLSSEDEM